MLVSSGTPATAMLAVGAEAAEEAVVAHLWRSNGAAMVPRHISRFCALSGTRAVDSALCMRVPRTSSAPVTLPHAVCTIRTDAEANAALVGSVTDDPCRARRAWAVAHAVTVSEH